MRTLLIFALLLLAGVVQADSTLFTGANFRLSQIEAADAERIYSSAFTSSRVELANGSQMNYTLFIIDHVRDSIGATATIDSIACTLDVHATDSAGWIGVYTAFKPIKDTVASWQDWDELNGDSTWGTAGCNNADDAGTDNSSDGSGVDRSASAYDTIVTSGFTACRFSLLPAEESAEGTFKGVLIGIADGTGSTGVNFRFFNHWYATEANRPRAWVYYTEGEPPASNGTVIRKGTIRKGVIR